MAYKSKFTGEQVDELLTQIEEGDLDITVDTELSTTSPNAIANSAVATALLGKMAATPSGDPQHYLYEAVGAVYNATDSDTTTTGIYGDTIVHKSGCWLLNEVGDLTNEDMCVVLTNRPNWNATSLTTISAYSPARTVVPKTNWAQALGWFGSAVNIPMNGAFFSCANMETIQFSTGPDADYKIQPTHFSVAFRACPKLTKILNVINCKNISTFTHSFYGCNSLVEVRLFGLKANVSFSNSPLLSKKSILFMIEEEAATSAIVITLHATAYAMAMADSDISAALAEHTNVSLGNGSASA